MSSQGAPHGIQQPGLHPQQVMVNDHVASLKNLVVSMKESFGVLTKMMAANVQHNSQIDTGMKSNEGKVKSFDKPLEDFLAICNQVERHLKTISDCVVQQRDSQKYIPFSFSSKLEASGPVEFTGPNPGPDTFISYNQYMNIVKSQVEFTKSVQGILTEAASKVGQHDVPPQVQHPPHPPTLLGNNSN